jgi:GR25 family glycosyltransferase involved in LPS biosynthesis
MPKSNFNRFFDKIFVISLFDKEERWKKVHDQFKKQGIDVERFVALDGRCSSQGRQGCIDKLRSFEMGYDVHINYDKHTNLQEIVPAACLTIGTITLLRTMVRKKWQRILICEDDIELTPDMKKRFNKGISEIGYTKWDTLYLGVGGEGGNEHITQYECDEDKGIVLQSQLNKYYDTHIYVKDRRDLRIPSQHSKKFSSQISWASRPGGTWSYSFSLSGAKKFLKIIDGNAGDHIDQILAECVEHGNIKALAFDPPIIFHEFGREDSSIPWSWD